MNLIVANDYDIDTEYAAEVNDYESKPILEQCIHAEYINTRNMLK